MDKKNVLVANGGSGDFDMLKDNVTAGGWELITCYGDDILIKKFTESDETLDIDDVRYILYDAVFTDKTEVDADEWGELIEQIENEPYVFCHLTIIAEG